jgi:hypothetical protein
MANKASGEALPRIVPVIANIDGIPIAPGGAQVARLHGRKVGAKPVRQARAALERPPGGACRARRLL